MRRTGLVAVLAALVGLALGALGVAAASIPDSSGVIHGCYKPADGKLRVIDTDAGQACATGETGLAWNQTGPQGPPGSDAGLPVVTADDTTASDSISFSAAVTCPAGKVPLSASAVTTNGTSRSASVVSFSTSVQAGGVLAFVSGNASERNQTVRVYVVCGGTAP